MKKAVLYARVSSEHQEKERTIESQIFELKKQIGKAGHILVKEYIDDGHSGFYLDRPAMNKLREDIKTNAFETVYFHAADRIAREVTYQNIIVGELIRHKKQIVIGGKDFVNNPENKLTLTVLGAVSEFERARIIERCMRGRKYWLRQGVLMSNGCQAYGYRYHKRTPTSFPSYTVNQKEAAIVREIYELYAKGDIGFKEIAAYLRKKSAYRRPNTGPWTKDHVRLILHNEMYTGIRYFDTMMDAREEQDPMHKVKTKKMVMRDRKDWIGVNISAIVSQELYTKVRTRIEHNRACYRNATFKQLLSGLIWCGKCGSRMHSFRQYYMAKRIRTDVHIYEKYLYTCRARRYPGACDTMQMDVRPINNCVFDMIRDHILTPEVLKKSIVSLNKWVNKEKVEAQVHSLEQQIKETATKKNRIIDLYASGDLDKEEYLKRVTQYDSEAISLKTKRDDMLTRVPVVHKPDVMETTLKDYCANVKDRLEQCKDFETRRRFLVDFIEKVTYRNDRITVQGSVPIRTSKAEFIIKQNMDREKLRDEILQRDRKAGRSGSMIRRDYFGHLITKAKVLSPRV